MPSGLLPDEWCWLMNWASALGRKWRQEDILPVSPTVPIFLQLNKSFSDSVSVHIGTRTGTNQKHKSKRTMLSNYGYGLTDNSPNTPWNEPLVPDHEFDVEVTVTLSNSTTVTTNDYMPDVDEEDGRMYPDTSSTDWEKAYTENCYTIPQMLEELKVLLEEKLADPNCKKKTKYKQMLEDCQGWELIESEVSEM